MKDYALLEEKFSPFACEREFCFARHTTVGSGGVAAFALSPDSIESAAACMNLLKREELAYIFLGAGANVLPADGRFEGAVVRFCRMRSLYCGDGFLYAGAGVTGGELLRFAREQNITGFEPFTGIPMTIGGGCAMNAGIGSRHFSDLVTEVVALDRGKLRVFSNRECKFSCKDSVFLSGIAVLGVCFRAQKAQKEEIDRLTSFYAERRRHLPKGRSMGCTFVNPAHISAGALIERCGLKGRRVGSAYVSEAHANFIINEGNCSKDIASLIDTIKEEVYKKTGILLREEIRRIP